MSQHVEVSDKMKIMEHYMEYVLTNGKAPDNVFVFAAHCDISEATFYASYTSFESIEKSAFSAFLEHTLQLLSENEAYKDFQLKDKLLSFFYTFFEILTANRSFVLFVLDKQKTPLKSIHFFSQLKEEVKAYSKDLAFRKIDFKNNRLNTFQDKGFDEMVWGKLVMFINFWKNDTSPGFEKTDLFIEKLLVAYFDLVRIEPVKSIVDLGKFLWKETLKKY
ncbi:TetR family transcriptional regulator C-terminal domain-containing protein [Aquimarina hainanensis]|uniref:TetR family transcriptional regulator C-terminal domain-containing protein n=1 Tax=Aquimarina hainanensis TaxID=1578017 RepID=A0ABW5NDF8_9FLAO